MASKNKSNPPKRGKGAAAKRETSASDPGVLGDGRKVVEDEAALTAVEADDGAEADVASVDGAQQADISAAARHVKFPVVGIGASAGGLDALQIFFGNMPPDSGAAFVVVTHQHPGHVSLLPELLSKATRMSVVEARDGLVVEPNHVYVGPPGGLLGITSGVLRRLEGETTLTPHLPIDYFFRSLATDQREHAICVVLSGTGTDGTLGMRAVKAETGMAMVQEPPSAKYAGMPTSASATGLADYVLPAEAMPAQLVAYTKGPYLKPRTPAVEAPLLPKEPLQRMLILLRARTGHDFTCYKLTTIRRRIERRMNVHQIKEPHEYLRYLQENPHEIDMLFGELLISVTSFFRDSQAFDALMVKPLPELMESRADDHTFRVWVPGCASGEEAYSIAILLHECMEKLKHRFDVQIFGTDLDAHAIEAARAGVYSGGITADVSKERLDRYFLHEDNFYRVRKDIREMLVFAPQNVIKDPPFTKVDMVVCRNLLIYLDTEVQRRLLPVLHYALRPGGLLFLGPSESISGNSELFEAVDNKWKIFRRREVLAPVHPVMDLLPERPMPHLAEVAPPSALLGVRPSHTVTQVERLLISKFAPTSVVVDDRGNIVYIHGRSGQYLEPAEGQPRHNILEMARRGLARPLANALHQAAVEKKEVTRPNLRVKTNGEFASVDLSVSWIDKPESIRGLLLVAITPAAPPPAKTPYAGTTEEQPNRVQELENELQYTKESLQTTIEELETSNEELKSTNEELQSTNEELQSANEELETSKEEMQSLNEELSTVNAELQAKVDELSRTTDDMQNLLNSTQVATIFLDNQFHVKRYTDRAKELFSFIQTDIGRPLSHLTSNLDYDGFLDDCREVLRTLVPKEVEVRTRDDGWHLMRIMPYRTAENVIDGVVVTFVEISRVKQAELEAASLCQCFDTVVQTAREPLVMLDLDHRVAAANEAFCRLFGTSRQHIAGKPLAEVGDGLWNSPSVRGLLDELSRRPDGVANFELLDDSPETGRRVFHLNASRLDRGPRAARMIVLALSDGS